MVPSHNLRGALEATMDLLPLNRKQHQLLFNPDAEVNSLAERIVALRHHGIPEPVIKGLINDVRELLTLNAAEGAGARTVTGLLDELAVAMAHAERNRDAAEAIVAAESIKQVACQLRPHLAVLRDPGSYDGTAWSVAQATVQDVIARTPRSRLLSPTMRNQLRKGPYRQLEALMSQVPA